MTDPSGGSVGQTAAMGRTGFVRAVAVVGLVLAGVACSDLPDSVTSGGTVTAACEDVLALSVDVGHGTPEVLVDDGTGLRSITPGQVTTDPSFSPDGSTLVVVRAEGDYESAGPDSTELRLLDPDGSNPRDLVDGSSTTWRRTRPGHPTGGRSCSRGTPAAPGAGCS